MAARSIATTLALTATLALTLGACANGSDQSAGATTTTVAVPSPSQSGSGDMGTTPAAPAASTSSPAAPVTSATTVTVTASGPTTVTAAPATTTTVTPTVTQTIAPAPKHLVEGQPGGSLTVDGKEFGRGNGSTSEFLALMGTPASTANRPCVEGGTKVPAREFRWGDLRVTVIDGDVPGEYGFAWPKGQVNGWSIDPAPAGTPLVQGISGPQGTSYGTSLATLRSRFTTKEWDSVTVDVHNGVKSFNIFAGDTHGATFKLGPNDTVTSMSAGFMC